MGGTAFKLVKFAGVILLAAYCVYYFRTRDDFHFIDNADLYIHELGHLVMQFFGQFINIAAGSLFQLLAPLFAAIHFWQRGYRFSSAAACMWLAISFMNVGVYAADAVAMNLHLVGMGETIIHDWNYMLSAVGLLNHAGAVAAVITGLGFFSIAAGLFLAWQGFTEESHEEMPSGA